MRYILFFLVLAFLVVISYVAFNYYTSHSTLSEEISEGAIYGFSIGSEKSVVYSQLMRNLAPLTKNKFVYYTKSNEPELVRQYSGDETSEGILVQTRFLPSNFERFRKLNQWKVYFDGDPNNYIEFAFCGESLCRIKRYRQYYELP